MSRGWSGLVMALALAGCGDDSEPPADDGSAASSGSSSSSGSGDAGSSTNTTSAEDSTTDEPEVDTSDPAETGEQDSTGEGPDIKGVCVATCEHLKKCGLEKDIPNCDVPCASVWGLIVGCEDEYIAQQECVLALSCEDTVEWSESASNDYPCIAADDALSACING